MPRRRPDPRAPKRFGLGLSFVALVLACLLALAAPGSPRSDDAGDLSVLLADGTLSHDNSRDGSAILSASGIWPGWSGEGDVTITNTGSAGSWLRLTQASVDDLPGPEGGLLSERLGLLIQDATVPGFAVPVYSGTLGALGQRWLGRMEPGEERTYRFRTQMPAQAGDNDYQASAVNVRFEWAMSDTDPSAPPPTEPPTEPPVSDPPVTEPPVSDPPVTDPPVSDPPIQVVPDGPPVVKVNRGRLRVKLAIPVAQRPLRRRKLLVLASCSRSCQAKVGGRLGRKSRASRIARVSRVLPAGIKQRVKLRIKRKTLKRAWRRLGRGKTVRGNVTLVARDSLGRRAKARQRIRLVPARR